MNVRTQDGKTVIPCNAIDSRYNDGYKAWDIVCISSITGKDIKLLGTYSDEDQYRGIFNELQGWMSNRSLRSRTYYMPLDVQAITETSITFTDLNLGID